MAHHTYKSIPELAQELGLTRMTVYNRVKKGQIGATKVGRSFTVTAKENQYLSVLQLAKILGISRIAVYKRVKKGQIKFIKVGRRFLIPLSFLEQNNIYHQTHKSLPELAAQTGASRATIYNKVKAGKIQAVKVGHRYTIAAKEGEYISIPQLAGILGISRIAVYKQVKKGKIQAKKVGRNHLIPIAVLKEQMGDDVIQRINNFLKKRGTK